MGKPTDRRLADQQEVLAAGVGIALWAIAFVVLAVFFRPDLQRHHTTWWLWSCGIGLLLGLYGLRTAVRRRDR